MEGERRGEGKRGVGKEKIKGVGNKNREEGIGFNSRFNKA